MVAALPNIEAMLQLAMLAMIRPGATMLAAPVFGAQNVPLSLRMVLALAVGFPSLGGQAIAIPADGILSWAGFLFVLGEIVIGLMMGFALQLALAAALIAGETISNTIGLGFAMTVDPTGGGMNTAFGQLLALLATALLLASDGHLLLLGAIAESYTALPPGQGFPDRDALAVLTAFGGTMFAAAVAIALPVAAALVLVQIVLGVMARSAPALNLFAVGLPATLLLGIVLVTFALPSMAEVIVRLLSDALALARVLAG